MSRSQERTTQHCNPSRVRRPAAALALVLATFVTALAAQSAAAAKVPSDFFGIFAEGPSKKDYRGMGDAGFGTNRVPVNWGQIQKKRNGPYDWHSSDLGVYYSAKNGMRPTLVVYGTPRFVHKDTGKGLYGPEDKADLKAWRKFSEALARRYSPNGDYFDAVPEIDNLPVKTWIAWNEQNSKNNWAPKPDPKAYANLVESFDKGISKVDPKAKIVLGGMYGFPRDPKSMKATKFLKKMYKVGGIAKHFDAINSHPYGSGVADVKKQVNDLRSAARKAGDRNVGILVGELGWASKGPARSESVVGKKGQADRLEDGLKMLIKKRKKWNVLGAYVYTWRDFPAGQLACNWCPWSGLVTKKSKPKPALKAVEKVIRKNR
ncbi:MAG: hypothetical protein U0R51_14355 [Solirubrobacterales bacterium]